MATISSQSLQSLRPTAKSPCQFLCFKSPSPSLAPVSSLKPIKNNTTLNGTRIWRLVARASAAEFSGNIGELLGDVGIFTASARPVFFKDQLDQNEGVAVVALLRHFGCPCW